MSTRHRSITEHHGAYMRILYALSIVSLYMINSACMSRRVGRDDELLKISLSDIEAKKSQAMFFLDENHSKVSISSIIEKPSLIHETMNVPTFKIHLSDANFVKIVRCHAHFKDYYEFEHLGEEEEPAQDKSQQWLAIKVNDSCEHISTLYTSKEYQDFMIRDDEYFYILNPCISASFSYDGQEKCSYDLTHSEVVQHQDPQSSDSINLMRDMIHLEEQYDRVLLQLSGYVNYILEEPDSCLDLVKEPSQAKINGRRKALLSLLNQNKSFGVRDVLKNFVALNAKGPLLENEKQNDVILFHDFFKIAQTLEKTFKSIENLSRTDFECETSKDYVQKILAFKKSKMIDQIVDELVRISSLLHHEDDGFKAYSKDVFKTKSLRPLS